jgi:hypothetical protein
MARPARPVLPAILASTPCRSVIAVGALLAALWTIDAVPVVPLSPMPDDEVEAPAVIQSQPAHPYLRTALEEFLIVGVGSIWYWRHPAKNSGELRFDWTDWRAKMFSTRMIVFDNDLFATNGLAHPFAGAIYYQVARGNGLSPLASLVASFLTSTAWEYFAEWDEKPSTNDLIFTPAGGAVIGEATYRLGRMFAAGSPSVGNCMGALLFSPVATLNEARVCRTGENQPTDDFGLPARTWHYLSFNLGQAYFSFDGGAVGTALDLGLGVAIVDHRGYRQPGTGLGAISPGEWTELAWENLLSHGGLRGLRIHAGGAWWGRYYRSYAVRDQTAHRETDGWGLMLGLGSTFDFDSRVLPLEWDRVVTAGLAGPMLEYSHRHGGLLTRATLTAQYGFSMVTSLAFPDAAAAYAGGTVKTELEQQGYYYAHSLTGAATLSLNHEPIELYLRARLGAYWSINSDDRHQGQITDNFSLRDQRIYLRAAATVRILGGPLRAALAVDQINRDSQLPGSSYSGVERRASLSAETVF